MRRLPRGCRPRPSRTARQDASRDSSDRPLAAAARWTRLSAPSPSRCGPALGQASGWGKLSRTRTACPTAAAAAKALARLLPVKANCNGLPMGSPSNPRVTTSSVFSSKASVSLMAREDSPASSMKRRAISSPRLRASRARPRCRESCSAGGKYGVLYQAVATVPAGDRKVKWKSVERLRSVRSPTVQVRDSGSIECLSARATRALCSTSAPGVSGLWSNGTGWPSSRSACPSFSRTRVSGRTARDLR